MTRSRYYIREPEYPHFMTCTIVGWLPVFTRPEAVQIILDSWTHLKLHHNFKLFGFVILENHLHLAAAATDLQAVMKNFKSFTARQIVDLLREKGAETLLWQMRLFKKRYKTESEFQVWQEGNKPKQIQNDDMMRQKLTYMHENPLKRGYVDEPVHWRYSSARNYAGLPGVIDVVTDWA